MSVYSHVCQVSDKHCGGTEGCWEFAQRNPEGLFVPTELKSKREIGAVLKMVSSYNVNDLGTVRESPGVFSCFKGSSGQKEEPSWTGNRPTMKPLSLWFSVTCCQLFLFSEREFQIQL